MSVDKTKWLKYLKTLAIAVGVFLLMVLAGYFLFRNILLEKAITKVGAKFKENYQIEFKVGKAYFSGISLVNIDKLSLTPEWTDTLLTIDQVKTGISISDLLLGKIRFSSLSIISAHARLNNKDSSTYKNRLQSSVSKSDDVGKTTKIENTNFAKTAYKWIDLLFDAIPRELILNNCVLDVTYDGIHQQVRLSELTLIDDVLKGQMKIVAPDRTQHWIATGNLDVSQKQADVQVYTTDSARMMLPFVNQKWALAFMFRSIKVQVGEIDFSSGTLILAGDMQMQDVLINHPKISSKDVLLPDLNVHYNYTVGENRITLDSSTCIRIDKLSVYPFVQLDLSNDTTFNASLVIPKTKAQDFVNALPEGLFNHIRGMQIDGDFDFRMDFSYNENKPQDLYFETGFNKYNLHITKYGEANIAKLNGEFVYTPLERGRPGRPILVGVGNPNYTPLDQISPYLQKCVLTCEDPSFFYHRGFIDEAFRQSIIKNIRTRKFARGASTISMQLIKNVFLTREKTLSRKLEEILLVYIIENNRLVSKERMLEVYFNIIEWGPNVYGIGEAAQFYFSKHPSQLNLSECLFLSTIVPRPKGFMWRFDKQGLQKEFVGKQYRFLSNIMVRRNVLMPEDTAGINFRVPITGPAKEFIKITPDSTNLESELEFDETGRLKILQDEE